MCCRYVLPGMLLILLFAGSGLAQSAQSSSATDEENCLICHRYPAMGRYDENGNKRVYYVNDQLFSASVHGQLRCKSCHTDVDKIPHGDVKKVDCATQCHIKDPSSNREFSHKRMVDLYEGSVHGKNAHESKVFVEDLPTCTYCHANRQYNPYAGYWGNSEALSRETLARCQGCHTNKEWTKKVYAHFTHRMRRRRSQSEIIRLCTSCHEDEKKMARHGLEPVSTFKDTFHWTLVKYGVQNAPDCISCHVPVGYSTHEIEPRSNPISPINKANRVKTCSNQGGIQTCHPGASARFADGRVHAYGTKVQLMAAEEEVKAKAQKEEPLLMARAAKEVSPQELLHFRILSLIKLAYKILIGLVIGFMSLHQLLDFRCARKRIKMEDLEYLKHKSEDADTGHSEKND